MSKIKTVFWVVLIGLIALAFYQNRAFLMSKQILQIDLPFLKKQTLEITIAVIFLAFFLAGLLFAYFYGLAERFKLKKTIKSLNTKIASLPPEMPSTDKEAEAITRTLSEPNQSVDKSDTDQSADKPVI